jgi:hypothetical protein
MPRTDRADAKQPELPRAITVEAPGVQKIDLGVTLDELWAERDQLRGRG